MEKRVRAFVVGGRVVALRAEVVVGGRVIGEATLLAPDVLADAQAEAARCRNAITVEGVAA